ncbi:heterokaryon incompatibility protein-domain-containing protein, partial [Rhypophila decipiens]
LRLLRIQQAPSCQDPIQCTLIHETLHQLLPPFEAISYTWADESGDSLKKATISIDSRVFGVTLNCERALRRVRLRTQSRLVWIDAICINQDSDAEKTHQVQLMAQIYARAKRVLIYIG